VRGLLEPFIKLFPFKMSVALRCSLLTSLLTLDFALDLALDCALDGGRHGRQTTDRDEPSGDIISVASPELALAFVPLRSKYQRRNDHRPAICDRHHPLTGRHGPAADHARSAGHHSPVPRREPRGMPTTRPPAGPLRRRPAWGGGRAMHPTPSPAAEFAAVAPEAGRERSR
jgi:hypothetical protein